MKVILLLNFCTFLQSLLFFRSLLLSQELSSRLSVTRGPVDGQISGLKNLFYLNALSMNYKLNQLSVYVYISQVQQRRDLQHLETGFAYLLFKPRAYRTHNIWKGDRKKVWYKGYLGLCIWYIKIKRILCHRFVSLALALGLIRVSG